MPFAHQLDILRELREEAGLSQEEMARLCGLHGRQRRQTAGAWERGEIIPSRSRRNRFIGYLWDALKLRNDVPRFEAVWEVLMQAWGWDAIDNHEWASFTPQPRPNPIASAARSNSRVNETAGLAVLHPVEVAQSPRLALDATLYTQPGRVNRPAILFGRATLFDRAYRCLSEGKDLLLTGVGGTGKSALAAALVDHWLVEGNGVVLWVGADESSIDTILEAMCVPLDGSQGLAQTRNNARFHFIQNLLMRENVRLVVLDNLEHVEMLGSVRRTIPPNASLLVTSRYDAAHIDEAIKVPDLQPEDAHALLAHHAQNSQYPQAFYLADEATAELCAWLRYHCLGIMIASGWLKQSRRRAADLLQRLQHGTISPLTLEMPPAARQAGHHSVAEALAQTIPLLGWGAELLFRAWGSLAVPQATSEFLGYFTEMGAHAVEDALDEMVAWNFAEREGSNCYRMHELIHHFAQRYSGESQRATDLHTPETAVLHFLSRHADDFENLNHNLANVLVSTAVADEITLLNMVEPLIRGGFLDAYGCRSALITLLDRAITTLQEMESQSPLADPLRDLYHLLWSKRGNAAFDHAEYGEAVTDYLNALEVAPTEARTIRLMALAAKALAFRGDAESAQSMFAQAHELNIDNERLRSFVLEQEAHVAGHHGDHLMAWRVASEQVAINRKLLANGGNTASSTESGTETAAETVEEDRAALFHSLINLGTALVRGQGRWEQGLSLLQEALALAKQAKGVEWEAHGSWAMAELYHRMGDRTQAAHYLQTALKLYQAQEKLRDRDEVMAFARQHEYLDV